jgi:UDP-glucose 4-epimerase
MIGKVPLIDENLINLPKVVKVLDKYKIDAVIHLAGWKCVPESEEIPLWYYFNNVACSIILFNAMKKVGCKKLIFSSSCAVYGNPIQYPISEIHRTQPISTYGKTKLIVENILQDWYRTDNSMQINLLRYFNPIGAVIVLGDTQTNKPNNLLPYISQVALGKLDKLKIFGNDYETYDGTGIRDYLHIEDLAYGHVAALEMLEPECNIYNLGTGYGHSVLDIVEKFEEVTGIKIPYEFAPRRFGDCAVAVADVEKARNDLGLKFDHYDLSYMIATAWDFQKRFPNGYVP